MTTLVHPAPSPAYTPQDVELSRLDSTSSVLTAPPPYDEAAAASFHPTLHLQIETPGKHWFSLPLPPRPDPVPIFTLHPEESSSSAISHTPKFTSFRPERCSGSCYLTSESNTTLSTTTYRFGPKRPPHVQLFSPTPSPISSTTQQSTLSPNDDHPAENEWDTFTLTSLGLLTRSIAFRARLGTFQWRYASRKERQAHSRSYGSGISSLLVLERVVRVAHARNTPSSSSSHTGSKDEEVRTVVAHFLRGGAYRAAGSSGSSAGNGGRLVIDELALGTGAGAEGGLEWAAEERKEDREMGVVMVVTTCLVMLKREIDRRRAQQAAIMAGAAGGS